MKKIRLSKFKAFEDEVSILLDGKNLLLYGENGAGKSSIYESIKTTFFHNRLESHITASTPEVLQQLKRDFWSKYNNKIQNQDFEIQINDQNYKVFDTTPFQVFMISFQDIRLQNKLGLKELLRNYFLSITDLDQLCEDFYDSFQQEVNLTLRSFNETVSIDIDPEDDFSIKIMDTSKNIESRSDVAVFFNEAKLNLIILLVLLNVIFISKEKNLKKVLVLDDFITSLDSSNRIFLIRYIFSKFSDSQILIFTHNISFYNLVMFIVNTINGASTLWTFANLYEINNKHRLYQKPGLDKVLDIKTAYDKLGEPKGVGEVETIGNRVRKKFEVLLYEFSKLLMIGAVEESNKIIERISSDKAIYYSGNKTLNDLIDELEMILNQDIAFNLKGRLQSKINSYKKADFKTFKKLIKDLKLYQKVTMHPMSHGVAGMPTFTTKELEESLDLLGKMEKFIVDMVDGNVATV